MGFRIEAETVTFWLRVKPGVRRERLTQNAAGELCLEVRAPAVEGQANQACVVFLARALRLPRSAVEILAGHKSRRKVVRVAGRLAQETISRLERLASEEGNQESRVESQG
jgi:uncharacterized protein (TIGR00251 family)